MTSYINSECDLLNIPDDKKFRLYFYALIAHGKAMLKPGKTKQKLRDRIPQYLLREHKNMSKDMSSFRLIAVYEFKSEKMLSKAEEFLKEGFSDFPTNPGQHYNVEQYKLESCWNLLKGLLQSPLLCKNRWVRKNADQAVAEIITKATLLKEDLTSNESFSENEDDDDEKKVTDLRIKLYFERRN